jgi:hypothetical protein
MILHEGALIRRAPPEEARDTLTADPVMSVRAAPTAMVMQHPTMPLAPRMRIRIGDVHGGAFSFAVPSLPAEDLGHHPPI